MHYAAIWFYLILFYFILFFFVFLFSFFFRLGKAVNKQKLLLEGYKRYFERKTEESVQPAPAEKQQEKAASKKDKQSQNKEVSLC